MEGGGGAPRPGRPAGLNPRRRHHSQATCRGREGPSSPERILPPAPVSGSALVMLTTIVALPLPVALVLRPMPMIPLRPPSLLTVGRPPVARIAHGVLAIRPGPLIIVLPAAIAAGFVLGQR